MASPWGPEHIGPTQAICVAVCDALAQLHGRPSQKRHEPRIGCELQTPHTVLDSLVRTILSQNTTDITSQRAFSSLKAAFPEWEQVRTAPAGAVEASIRVGGLADIKAARIKSILNSLLEERGSLSLEHLRHLPVEDIKTQLSRYKGVGPKTIACVLMFCLGRAEFPVDTHVWEISKQLGWVPANATREQTYEHLNKLVPDDIKYDLHVLMVQHGKVCSHCGKRSSGQKRKVPDNHVCPLAAFKHAKSKHARSSTEGIAGKKGKTSSCRGTAALRKFATEVASINCEVSELQAAQAAAAAALDMQVEQNQTGMATSGITRRSARRKQQHLLKQQREEEFQSDQLVHVKIEHENQKKCFAAGAGTQSLVVERPTVSIKLENATL